MSSSNILPFILIWQKSFLISIGYGKDSSLRVYYGVREENICGVVINVREMFVLF